MKLNKRRALDRRQLDDRRKVDRPQATERRKEPPLPPGHTPEDVTASLHGRGTVIADCSVGTSIMRQVVRKIGQLYSISFYTSTGCK